MQSVCLEGEKSCMQEKYGAETQMFMFFAIGCSARFSLRGKVTKCYKGDTKDSQVIPGLPMKSNRHTRTTRKTRGEGGGGDFTTKPQSSEPNTRIQDSGSQ
jgi:hypothetical protein